MTRILSGLTVLALLLVNASCGDAAQAPQHPSAGAAIEFQSHDAIIKGFLFRPAGAGVHPTVVLLQGMPGNPQPSGLAQTIRGAGWTVIAFNYRGSWGSGGTYRLANGPGDVHALLEQLARPEAASAWGVDASKIALVGHSYGGYVAARVAADTPALLGAALLAPWDISLDQRTWAALPPARREALAMETFIGAERRLPGVSARALTDEVMHDGADFDLTALAPRLAPLPLLIVTVTRDDNDDKALGLLPALIRLHAPHLTARLMDTDHSFDDRWNELQTVVVRWLASLPGAPR